MTTIHTALITTKHGTDVYASRTHEGLIKQVAAWCREWWDDAVRYHEYAEDFPESPPEDDNKAWRLYFEDNEFEFLDIGTTELGD